MMLLLNSKERKAYKRLHRSPKLSRITIAY
uniref:Uncharacterized protein n=1 Tax=Rhizophora mucronata TaxID=61149 RepID=A0A2P2QWL9_RHIMU